MSVHSIWIIHTHIKYSTCHEILSSSTNWSFETDSKNVSKPGRRWTANFNHLFTFKWYSTFIFQIVISIRISNRCSSIIPPYCKEFVDPCRRIFSFARRKFFQYSAFVRRRNRFLIFKQIPSLKRKKVNDLFIRVFMREKTRQKNPKKLYRKYRIHFHCRRIYLDFDPKLKEKLPHPFFFCRFYHSECGYKQFTTRSRQEI